MTRKLTPGEHPPDSIRIAARNYAATCNALQLASDTLALAGGAYWEAKKAYDKARDEQNTAYYAIMAAAAAQA